MLQILFRVITILVGLIGFVVTSLACEKHNNPTATTEQSASVGQKESSVIKEDEIAEEFRVSVKQVDENRLSSASASLNELPKENVKEAKETTVNPVIKEENVKETTATPAVSQDIQVIQFVLANKVEGREPKEIVEGFKRENGKGFAFAELSAVKNSQVTFVWFREGKEHARFTTNVHASKRWRTFSSTKLRPGNWKVQLVAGDQVLAERSFTVE